MRLRCTTFALLAAVAGGAQTQPQTQPQAQPMDRNPWLEIQGASIGNDATSGLKRSTGMGLAGGQWLTPHWAWEAGLLRDPVKTQAGNWNSMEVHAHGSALFAPLPHPGWLNPYLRVGLGLSGGAFEPPRATPGTVQGLGLSATQLNTANTPSTTTRVSLLAGIGLQTWLGTHGFATFEARQLRIQVTATTTQIETQALLGLGYRWHTPGTGTGNGSLTGNLTDPVPLPVPGPPTPPLPLTLQPQPGPGPAPAPAPAPTPEPPPKGRTGAGPDPDAITPGPAPLPAPDFEPRPRPEPDGGGSATEPSWRARARAAEGRETVIRKFVLDETVLHFDNDSDRVSKAGEKTIRDVAARLRRTKGFYRLDVVGHTSSVGPRAYNKDLSLRRAKAVAKVLIQAGIPASRITARGVGSDEPVASDATARGQSRNRRVEILVKVPGAAPAAKRHAAAPGGHAPARRRPVRRKPLGARDS